MDTILHVERGPDSKADLAALEAILLERIEQARVFGGVRRASYPEEEGWTYTLRISVEAWDPGNQGAQAAGTLLGCLALGPVGLLASAAGRGAALGLDVRLSRAGGATLDEFGEEGTIQDVWIGAKGSRMTALTERVAGVVIDRCRTTIERGHPPPPSRAGCLAAIAIGVGAIGAFLS